MGHLGVVKTLLKADASIDARDKYECTPLIKASFKQHVDVAEILLKAGASINARDDRGWITLIWASWHGHAGLVEKLLKAGAALNWEQTPGEIALRCPAERGHRQTTELLLAAGADLRVRDIYGSTVLYTMLARNECKAYTSCGCGFCARTTRLEDMLKDFDSDWERDNLIMHKYNHHWM